MACPFFLPDLPLSDFSGFYTGECAADVFGSSIGPGTLRCCNTGYAREACARAAESESDAFRFLVKAERAGIVDVAWSSERNHHPVAVGTLAVDPAQAAGRDPLERQARACAVAYIAQAGRPPG